jgi:hypothetical protein
MYPLFCFIENFYRTNEQKVTKNTTYGCDLLYTHIKKQYHKMIIITLLIIFRMEPFYIIIIII